MNISSGRLVSFNERDLVPIEGCWVSRVDTPERVGRVARRVESGLSVDFGPGAGETILRPGEWRCGLRPGFTVQDIPLSAARSTMGPGTVLDVREICGREQALVQFHETGESRWLPFERLRRILDPLHRYVRAIQHNDRPAERTALNVMGHALRLWNEATGALDRLDVDPLPHQISLVHHILGSGTTNWLIADDVGLGKTIEVGLLLAALERKRAIRRILVVVPAGLTQQWKEEMDVKFDRRFLIYGRDFDVSSAKEWPLFERVVVSLDLAKPQNADDAGADVSTRFGMLLAAGTWDIVIFDEAHRLSRGARGDTTLRYRLARALRERTDAMLLLTGTPHQGDTAKFQNLLTLVRPELAEQIQMLELNPEVAREMILRNRKIDAVDADGQFLFRGTLVRRVEIGSTPETARLERMLRDYLRTGYAAGDRVGGRDGRAIGFVMTIYRKLASSSVAALWIAMKKRRARLQGLETDSRLLGADEASEGVGEVGDGNDLLSEVEVRDTRKPFFADEIAKLDVLIDHAAGCLRIDPKRMGLQEVVRELVVAKGQKLLIFTEYRSTQAYLDMALRGFGIHTALIHGGLKLDEKRAAIAAFEADAQVLISTEAGGEGLNLHRRCHVMINYDLPWNPARLTQRIGRLYRYGQKEQVVVVNLLARDTIDNEILSTAFAKLDTVVREMSPVNAEFDERYHAEVMGELLERLDIEELLVEAAKGRVDRSSDRIDAAIEQARRAKDIQDDVLAGAERFDSASWKGLGALSTWHLAQFIRRASPFLEITVEPHRTDFETFTLRLPAEMKSTFGEFGARTVIEATTRRGAVERSSGTVLLDFASPFVRHLVAAVASPEFEAGYGVVSDADAAEATMGVFLGRYQNDQGDVTGESLLVASRGADERIAVDNAAVLPLFNTALASEVADAADPASRLEQANALRDRAEAQMAESCNRFQHPNGLIPVAYLDFNVS